MLIKKHPYWTTAKGEKIRYKDLSDEHLKNIISDGYRNKRILAEAKKRNIAVKGRPIDNISDLDIFLWVETFSSCAISGNKLASKMCKLWEADRGAFMLILNKIEPN